MAATLLNVEYLVWGTEPFGYVATHLAFHALNVFLFYGFASLLPITRLSATGTAALSVPLMVHSIQDHGIIAVISSLLSHATDDTIFRIQVPKSAKSRTLGILHRAFNGKLGARLLAMAGPDGLSELDLNPDSEKSVDGRDCLFNIAPRRILEEQIPWSDL